MDLLRARALTSLPKCRGSVPGTSVRSLHDERSLRDERGMVTAEFAVVMLAFVVVLATALAAAAVSVSHVQTQEAARLGARAAARGDSDQSIKGVIERAAPGARVRVNRVGADVRVEVAVSARLPMLGLPLGPIEVRSHSIAEQEPN